MPVREPGIFRTGSLLYRAIHPTAAQRKGRQTMDLGANIAVRLQPIMGVVIIREVTGEIIRICPKSEVKPTLNYLLNERHNS